MLHIHTNSLKTSFVSCKYIYHDISEFEIIPHSYDFLRHLHISSNIDSSFDFSCDIDILDQNCILIDQFGITQDKHIHLYRSCHNQLSEYCQSSEAFVNFGWVRLISEEFQDLI